MPIKPVQEWGGAQSGPCWCQLNLPVEISLFPSEKSTLIEFGMMILLFSLTGSHARKSMHVALRLVAPSTSLSKRSMLQPTIQSDFQKPDWKRGTYQSSVFFLIDCRPAALFCSRLLGRKIYLYSCSVVSSYIRPS